MRAEVRRALHCPEDFDDGPLLSRRDSEAHPEHGFIVKDGNYLPGRCPGDRHRLASVFVQHLQRTVAPV
ncbi:hypothetical protein [Duganella sacchari]|uniref:hypothetical protein n=1 Tax=Duganella sacchari TaxID=551987 RepID=UPI001114BF55|nr:hypothetical protein [Duganella sacchari]